MRLRPLRILLAVAATWALGGDALGITLTASTNAVVPADQPISSADDFQQITSFGTAEASSSQSYDWTAAFGGYDFGGGPTPPGTVFTGDAFAQATSGTLRARAELAVTDFLPGTCTRAGTGSMIDCVNGDSATVTAFARYADTIVPSSSLALTLFALPRYDVSGTVIANGDVRSTLRILTSATGFPQTEILTFDTALSGSPLGYVGPLSPLAAFPVPLTSTFNFDVRVSAEVSLALDPDPAAGGHGGQVLFDTTLRFLGFSLFEDEAMTTRFTGPVTLTDSGGNTIPVLLPEPGTALLLLASLAFAAARRR